jgi:hypothetical protein
VAGGIDDGVGGGGRTLAWDDVVIGDDDVDAFGGQDRDAGFVAAALVGGDNQRRAEALDAGDDGLADPVAFGEAVAGDD